MHLTVKFYRPMFSRLEVVARTNKQTNKHTDTLTNKQTPPKTSTSLLYATPVGKQRIYDFDQVF